MANGNSSWQKTLIALVVSGGIMGGVGGSYIYADNKSEAVRLEVKKDMKEHTTEFRKTKEQVAQIQWLMKWMVQKENGGTLPDMPDFTEDEESDEE